MMSSDNFQNLKALVKNIKWSNNQKNDIKDLSYEELKFLSKELRDRKHKVLVLTKIKKIKNTSNIKILRRRVAFVETIINSNRLG